jgi:tetratricopeptide (TPR) repeat protein
MLEGLVDAHGMANDLEGCKATVEDILGLMAVAEASKNRQPTLIRLLQASIAFGLSDGAPLVADALAAAVQRESSPAPSLPVLMQAARAEALRGRGEAQAALDAMDAVPADEDAAAASTLACLVRARCYADLWRPAEACVEWERVVAQWQRDDGLPPIALLDALTGAARAQDALGRYAQAKRGYAAAAETADRVLEDKDVRRSMAAYDLAEFDRVLGLDGWQERMESLADSERARQRTSTRFYALLLRKRQVREEVVQRSAVGAVSAELRKEEHEAHVLRIATVKQASGRHESVTRPYHLGPRPSISHSQRHPTFTPWPPILSSSHSHL